MAEFECFHVSRQLAYHPTAALSAGDTFDAGSSHNPFFRFYENTRAYPVTMQDGQVVMLPALSFLKAVQAGEVNCGNLPAAAVEVANHYLMLARELIYEEVRREEDDQLPSRKTCLWASDDLAEAQNWHQFLGGSGQLLRLGVVGERHIADSNLLVADSEPLSTTYQKARSYWRGEGSPAPRWETLVSGQITVLEVI